MKKTLFTMFVSLLPIVSSCKQGSSSILKPKKPKTSSSYTSDAIPITPVKDSTIVTRFTAPKGFKRVELDTTSFAHYLRSLPLKPAGSKVAFYDGSLKPNYKVYDAVIDLPIGKKNLHQCADAVIRLRADYLFSQKQYGAIHFNFTNGFRVDYSEWMKGKRIVVNGNTVSWKQKKAPSNTDADYWHYLETIFTYAGTASLEKELKPVSLKDIAIGDVFIQGGFPGHAVIVVDMAIHKETKEKIILLAQSYMPAQELQILKNPNSGELSPWYSTKNLEILKTPEWTFEKTDVKRFME